MKPIRKAGLLCLATGVISLAVNQTALASSYVEVGPVGYPYKTWAFDINDHGKIVGYFYNSNDGKTHKYSWTEVDGYLQLPRDNSFPPKINIDDQILLDSSYVYEDGATYLLRGFYYATGSHSQGINNHGDVAGYAELSNSRSHAAKWSKDASGVYVTMDMGALPVATDLALVESKAYSINDNGETAGYSAIAGGWGQAYHVVKWDSQNNIYDLGTLRTDQSGNSSGAKINNRGQIIGQSDSDWAGGQHNFFWSQSTGMIDFNEALAGHLSQLGGSTVSPISLAAYAVDINDKGQVLVQAGAYKTITPTTTGFAFIYHDGVFTDITQQLYIPNLQSTVLKGLNNHGQVIGHGFWNGNGQDNRAYRFDLDLNEPTAIVGGWGQGYYPSGLDNTGETEYVSLTFYANGIYIYYESDQPSHDDNGGGAEIGKYRYDETAGQLTITEIIADGNGAAGLASWGDLPEPISATLANDILTLNQDASRSFARVK